MKPERQTPIKTQNGVKADSNMTESEISLWLFKIPNMPRPVMKTKRENGILFAFIAGQWILIHEGNPSPEEDD